MSKKSTKKLSEAEAVKKIAQYEKSGRRLGRIGSYSIMISVPVIMLTLVADLGWFAMICVVLFVVGCIFVYLNIRLRGKAESLVMDQLQDFYQVELERAFGPCQDTKEMTINQSLIRELRPVEQDWNMCNEWRFYEGYYHGIHFSVENVKLYEEHTDMDGIEKNTKFVGAVLRCEDICDPALDIALCGSRTDHQSDLMDPAVFRQFFSARTADDQPADHLVTPQLRELIQKMESIGTKYKVTALIFRNGEAILAISGYDFGYGLPSSGESLQNIDKVRRRFINSLNPVCDLIDILRDSYGK